jgi:hypothetical protein
VPGSAIAFDHFVRTVYDDPARFQGARECFHYTARRCEPCLFGVDDLAAFVLPLGLSVAESAGPAELAALVDLGPSRSIIDFARLAIAQVER